MLKCTYVLLQIERIIHQQRSLVDMGTYGVEGHTVDCSVIDQSILHANIQLKTVRTDLELP